MISYDVICVSSNVSMNIHMLRMCVCSHRSYSDQRRTEMTLGEYVTKWEAGEYDTQGNIRMLMSGLNIIMLPLRVCMWMGM